MAKDFKIKQTNVIPALFNGGVGNDDLVFKTNKGLVDFKRWFYLDWPKSDNFNNAVWANREQLVTDIYNAIVQLSFEISKSSIEVLASNGCRVMFEFLDSRHKQGQYITSIEQFDKPIIESFLAWLRNKPAKTDTGKLSTLGARRYYTSLKSILMYFTRQGRISKDIFPYAPFVNVNRSGKTTESYSKSDNAKIMRYLWSQVDLIRNERFEGPHRQLLAVLALVIAAKTGRNTSTILNLNTGCIEPHPLAPDTHVLFTGFKRRGMNTNVQAMRSSESIEDVFSANKSVEELVSLVKANTAALRSKFDSDSLFIMKEQSGSITPFYDKHFWKAVQGIYSNANLQDDAGKPLSIQVKRMRKTFATRIWQLTGGDPIKTSKLLGNTVPVMDKHYLDVTPEMERGHKLFGHVLTETLLGKPDNKQRIADKLSVDIANVDDLLIGNFNTGVGRCSDPYDGKFARGGKGPCTRFVACFRCPNQVILESDLYRLFSFYWLLVKERNFIGRKKWKKLYAWIIKVVEQEIEPAFDWDKVKQAKDKAYLEPHPMWRERKGLEVI